MAKNVLILSASPRKGGNSDTLCNQFRKGAQESGHKAEKIFLGEKNIGYCTGCGICNSGKACSQKDDMAELLQKMIASDVIVMATPVYFYTMNGQMKTFIDRCCARYTEITGKEFYFILAAAENDKAAMDTTVNEFRSFLSCLEDPTERSLIYGVGAWQVGDINNLPVMQEAYEMGKNI